MKSHSFKAFIAALLIAAAMCGCEKKSTSDEKQTTQPITAAVHDENTSFDNGTYSGKGFSLYADPRIWAYKSSENDTCDLRMITDKDIVSCGVSVYISDDDHGGKTAQEIVEEASKNENIIFTGPLVTAKFSFSYYEWAVDENTHARTYFADCGGKYLCVYAESSNFGFVDVKIADLLSTLKVTDNA